MKTINTAFINRVGPFLSGVGPFVGPFVGDGPFVGLFRWFPSPGPTARRLDGDP